MNTNATDATYGVTTEKRIQLLIEELIEQKRKATEQTRRLADTVERLNERLAADRKVTT